MEYEELDFDFFGAGIPHTAEAPPMEEVTGVPDGIIRAGLDGLWYLGETENLSLSEARSLVRNSLEQGIKCPCCHRFAKLYRRKLHSGMASRLVRCHSLTQTTGAEWIHVSDIYRWTHFRSVAPNDFPYLENWGLIASKPTDPHEDQKSSGFWRITEKGKKFVSGHRRVEKYVFIYDNIVDSFSEETTDIYEALGSRFSYQELMG